MWREAQNVIKYLMIKEGPGLRKRHTRLWMRDNHSAFGETK